MNDVVVFKYSSVVHDVTLRREREGEVSIVQTRCGQLRTFDSILAISDLNGFRFGNRRPCKRCFR